VHDAFFVKVINYWFTFIERYRFIQITYFFLCDPMDCSPPGSSVHGILQARILDWLTIPFSRGSSLTQGIFPDPGIELRSPALQVDSLPSEPPGKPFKRIVKENYQELHGHKFENLKEIHQFPDRHNVSKFAQRKK